MLFGFCAPPEIKSRYSTARNSLNTTELYQPQSPNVLKNKWSLDVIAVRLRTVNETRRLTLCIYYFVGNTAVKYESNKLVAGLRFLVVVLLTGAEGKQVSELAPGPRNGYFHPCAPLTGTVWSVTR
jgi:hypothetical protein